MNQKRWLFTALAASAVLIPAYVVHADAGQTIADGVYEVNFFTYKTGTNEKSGMSNRFSQPATLLIENGEATLQLRIITQNSMMANLVIPYKGKDTAMTTVSGTISDETRIIALPIEHFNKATTVQVDVLFPGAAVPVKQAFDLIVESPAAGSLSEQAIITAYNKNTTDLSILQHYLKPTATIQLEGSASIVHITASNREAIEYFTVNGQKALAVTEEKDGRATYKFYVSSTKELLDAVFYLNVNGQKSTQQAQLHLAVKGAPVMIANPFQDIDKDANKTAILTLLSKGIIKPAVSYNPTAGLTRSEFALMIARTLDLQSAPDAGFSDLTAMKSADSARYEAINALAAAGIVKKAEKFNPNTTITRQQAALMIYRAMQYHVGSDALDFGKNMGVYADGALITNEESQRAFSFLYASGAMTGSVDAKGVRRIEPDKALTRSQMAKVLHATLKYLGH